MFTLSSNERTATISQKLFAAAAYAVASSFIMVLNKMIFTTFNFHSFLFVAMLQYLGSIIVLSVQRSLGLVTFPSPWLYGRRAFLDIFPLPLMFFGNTVSGLGATAKLNMPMFVLLRRFSIVMTMLLEMWLLEKTFSSLVKWSVVWMVVGALIAAANDLTMDIGGVFFILLNDVFTATQGVVLRKKLDGKEDSERERLGSHGIMFYSNLFSFPLVLLGVVCIPSERKAVLEFDGWLNGRFLICLCGSAIMGFVLNYTLFLCTKYNSPLTTTVIGAGKNIITSYVGMLFRDYVHTPMIFLGINVSVIGSLMYNAAEWKKIRENDKQRQSNVKREKQMQQMEQGSSAATGGGDAEGLRERRAGVISV